MKALNDQYKTLVDILLKEKNADGYWSGRLSSSALATAVAIAAFKIRGENAQKTDLGLQWLLANVNTDGGFGDTPESPSNVSTTLLCYAAINYCGSEPAIKNVRVGMAKYLETEGILLNSDQITKSILKYYGKDYTFSVPILSMLVICNVLDQNAIQKIPQLPYEFTLFPNSWYSFFNMQMVSYAMPALIAVGIFVHKHRKYNNLLKKSVRNMAINPALRKLINMVPESGGFLEAIPLTAFVSMCLSVSGFENSIIVDKGIGFLKNLQRPDGSWPIDTDLSTWVTTLSIKALGEDIKQIQSEDQNEKLRNHLLSIQYTQKHPFNQALPGGWGWTSFSGSVPDVDDTSGAILALWELYTGSHEENMAIINGCKWLLKLQNNDGGFPTFCRGWGRLPFDASCADLTGHAIAALSCTLNKLNDKIPAPLNLSFSECIKKAVHYLKKHQHSSGFWLPLWFGNQLVSDKTNPVYGTAKVCTYLIDCLTTFDEKQQTEVEKMIQSAQQYLLKQQNTDGSWGGGYETEGSLEETSLAICALTKLDKDACLKGFEWMQSELNSTGILSKPIGLYFATLWYDEKMYPLVYYLEALRRTLNTNISTYKFLN
jgi:squalene-hopene/tetraprenyl-beta-curcumene cyclase